MFWRVSGLNAASPVDSILDKECYTLEELLDEDELIQECKSLNARLTAYLKQKETVEKLVRYLVVAPPPGADPKRSFKYPFTACEIFCCEVEGIFNTLLEHEELLALLFSLLESPRPLNCMLAGYFSRVMGSLLLRRTQDVMQYLQRRQGLLQELVHHVDTTSIAEVLVRLVGADEQRGFLSTNHLQWLSDTNLLYLLLDKLQPGQPAEAQSNAAEILAALAQSQVSPLTRNLADPAFLELLVERALRQHGVAVEINGDCSAAAGSLPAIDNGTSDTRGGAPASDLAAAEEWLDAVSGTIGNGDGEFGPGSNRHTAAGACIMALNVCISLVEPLPPSSAEQQAASQGLGLAALPSSAVDMAAAEVHAAMRVQATRCVAASIHHLVALLEPLDPGRHLPTSYGLLHPPVGLARLKAVELLAALLNSRDEAAELAVMGTRGVQRSMQLFLQFPFNNVLHRHVAGLVSALDGGSSRLGDFFLGECGLLEWLIAAPTEVQVMPTLRPDAEHGVNRQLLRAGYAGHVTQMSNRLIQIANEGHQQLRAAMETHQGWQAYVKERLEPRNAQENVFAWKCGRPPVHEQVAEADMFQTELDFARVEGEAFTRDVYQRYGVFASHEDEEIAMDLASAAGVSGVGPPGAVGPGKLPLLPSVGPQPFPVIGSSSSSSSSSEEDEEGSGASGSGRSSEGGEISVAPAPEGDMPPLDDDADMADDAVMLEEYDAAAAAAMSLAQLSVEDGGDAAATLAPKQVDMQRAAVLTTGS